MCRQEKGEEETCRASATVSPTHYPTNERTNLWLTLFCFSPRRLVAPPLHPRAPKTKVGVQGNPISVCDPIPAVSLLTSHVDVTCQDLVSDWSAEEAVRRLQQGKVTHLSVWDPGLWAHLHQNRVPFLSRRSCLWRSFAPCRTNCCSWIWPSPPTTGTPSPP